jgi:NADPH:quinone reductase-like Zn-dependent oxidoreductase
MQAVQISEYGDSSVLEVAEAPDPHPGPGQVRVVVHAASVNPFDWKVRSGFVPGASLPLILGNDAAGVVDEIGPGVSGITLGEAVFGLGSATNAEFAVLDAFVPKPRSVDFPTAAALAVGAETSARAFGLLGVGKGTTLLVDGASGGVGTIAVQMAVARGAKVIGTSGEHNLHYVTALGASAVLYGEGLAERVREIAPDGVDAVLDVAGKTPITDLTGLVADPAQVVSIANFSAHEAGARVTGGGEGDPVAALTEAAALAGSGKLEIEVREFPLADVAEAHDLSQSGHVRGKLVIVI